MAIISAEKYIQSQIITLLSANITDAQYLQVLPPEGIVENRGQVIVVNTPIISSINQYSYTMNTAEVDLELQVLTQWRATSEGFLAAEEAQNLLIQNIRKYISNNIGNYLSILGVFNNYPRYTVENEEPIGKSLLHTVLNINFPVYYKKAQEFVL